MNNFDGFKVWIRGQDKVYTVDYRLESTYLLFSRY